MVGRIGIAQITGRVVRRINHGVDIIKIFYRISQTLTNKHIVGSALLGGKAKQIGGNVDRQIGHSFGNILKKIRNHLMALLLGIGINDVLQTAVGGKTNIIKINLIKAKARRFFSYAPRVMPNLRPSRIHPGQSFFIPPQTAGLGFNGPFRLFLG